MVTSTQLLMQADHSPKVRYAITELETLAVVWALSHFHAYLYGNNVTVYTDHSAVKAVLATPSANGKHARWWSKVYGTGVKSVNIIYRSGNENANADALSRNPVSPPPAQPFMSRFLPCRQRQPFPSC